ncbi:hypothetical protein [Methanolobus sp. WCC5]|uniref:hypothetical protein n=1 Tax=Methanolobus sp. WCC5 TaxID=3125785 RepID=UPI003252EC3C
MFTQFNYPRTITKVSVTEGYTNQSTGAWVPEITSETEIQAHVADVTLKERQYLDPGVVEAGVRKLICDSSVSLMVGDRVKITEEGDSVTEWLVNSKMSESNLMDQYVDVSRITYLIVKR